MMADFKYVSQAKVIGSNIGPKPPLDLSHHFSRVTAARKASSVKRFYKYFQIPGIAQLAGGLPHASLFPYDTLEAEVAQPERFTPTPNDLNDTSKDLVARLQSTSINKSKDVTASAHITVPHTSAITNPLQRIDLTTALQYGTAQGLPPLYSFVKQFTRENLHPNVPYLNGLDIILTNGSTDGLNKTLEALSNVWSEERDWVGERPGLLVEGFAYMNAIQSARPRGLQIVPVMMDSQGMLASGPGGLQDVLENWDESKGRRPHLMYSVTIGQNPTGVTLPIQRRKELYALCSKYDVIIIEDDPYWYLQFPSAAVLEAESRGLPPPDAEPVHEFAKSSGFPFLDSLVPSFLNIDPDGRVIRLDTFSKTVAPGCRLGWITAQPAIIERILRITESSTQQPSGFVQSMISELLIGPQPAKAEFAKKSKKDQLSFSGWETAGWVRWIEGLRGVYERRMNRMCRALDDGRFLVKQSTPIKAAEADWAVISKTKMYSFDWPRGGMFLWLQVHYENHPLAGQIDGARLAALLWILLASPPYLVLISPGETFCPTDEIRDERGWQFYRLCFAAVDEDEVAQSSKRLAEGVKAFWLIKDKKEMEEIGKDLDDESIDAEVADLSMNFAC